MTGYVFEILFWCSFIIVLYTYIGYGVVLYGLVKFKHFFCTLDQTFPEQGFPSVTLFITAYNEEKIIDEKMSNCRELEYPKEKLKIIWVTDGSNDRTNDLLAQYSDVTVYHTPERKGKTAAINRGMQFIATPFTVFTDANTMLNSEALTEIAEHFRNPQVGCVAGEKRIAIKEKDNASSGGEGFYWKYESKLKSWDSRLYSAVGAAGELFAIRTELFETMPEDTLLDDFILSMRIAQKGYKIAYCDTAYALETGSADMKNEEKRKVRIAAGGLQSICRLSSLLIPNPFHLGILRFQYISHRVLRWSVSPPLLFLLLPVNVLLVILSPDQILYTITLILQILFYIMAMAGNFLQQRRIKVKILFIPYYFIFMNVNVIKGFFYLRKFRGKGTWEKAERGKK